MTFFEYYRDRNNQDVLYLHGKNLSYNNHFHKSLEILYCVENKMEIILENKSYVIKKGEAFFVSSGLSHTINDYSENNVGVLIPPKYLALYFEKLKNNHPISPIIKGKNAKKLLTRINKYEEVVNLNNEFSSFSYVYDVLAICYDSLDFCKNLTAQKKDFDLISKVMHYIEENFQQPISLTSLSQMFKYNKYYLSELLHTELKCSLCDYVNTVRLENFCKNYDKNISIDEQIYKCGFNSRQTFYRAFKKRYHKTPTEL